MLGEGLFQTTSSIDSHSGAEHWSFQAVIASALADYVTNIANEWHSYHFCQLGSAEELV